MRFLPWCSFPNRASARRPWAVPEQLFCVSAGAPGALGEAQSCGTQAQGYRTLPGAAVLRQPRGAGTPGSSLLVLGRGGADPLPPHPLREHLPPCGGWLRASLPPRREGGDIRHTRSPPQSACAGCVVFLIRISGLERLNRLRGIIQGREEKQMLRTPVNLEH